MGTEAVPKCGAGCNCKGALPNALHARHVPAKCSRPHSVDKETRRAARRARWGWDADSSPRPPLRPRLRLRWRPRGRGLPGGRDRDHPGGRCQWLWRRGWARVLAPPSPGEGPPAAAWPLVSGRNVHAAGAGARGKGLRRRRCRLTRRGAWRRRGVRSGSDSGSGSGSGSRF